MQAVRSHTACTYISVNEIISFREIKTKMEHFMWRECTSGAEVNLARCKIGLEYVHLPLSLPLSGPLSF